MIKKSGYFSKPLLVVLALIAGSIFGLGVYTFIYAKGHSYFSNDPKSCVNCHVMREVYDRWNHSSHKRVASCNDCHTPHFLPAKILVKSINGWNHSSAFTTGDFLEPIQIKKMNRMVVQQNCLYCHGTLTADMNHQNTKEPTDCLSCHKGIGHGW